MKTVINLETKDVRIIISKFLRIPEEDVIPNRYSFAVSGLTEAQILERIGGNHDDNE